MKKTIIISIILFSLFASSCANRKQTQMQNERMQRSLRTQAQRAFIEKYSNVDTASFQQLERSHEILHMPDIWRIWQYRGVILRDERQAQIERQMRRYPRTQIRNIEQVSSWLTEVYTNNRAVRRALNSEQANSDITNSFYFSHYKQVEDGFLIKGKYIRSRLFDCHCTPTRWGIYLVGYNHNIVAISSWFIDPCPNKPRTKINTTIRFPEFENADVRFPELLDNCLDSLISRSIRYPSPSLELAEYGKVVVAFTVDTNGSVSDPKIVKNAESPALNREALRTVRFATGVSENAPESVWISGMKNGEKIPMEVQVEVDFVIDWGDFENAHPRNRRLVISR